MQFCDSCPKFGWRTLSLALPSPRFHRKPLEWARKSGGKTKTKTSSPSFWSCATRRMRVSFYGGYVICHLPTFSLFSRAILQISFLASCFHSPFAFFAGISQNKRFTATVMAFRIWPGVFGPKPSFIYSILFFLHLYCILYEYW